MFTKLTGTILSAFALLAAIASLATASGTAFNASLLSCMIGIGVVGLLSSQTAQIYAPTTSLLVITTLVFQKTGYIGLSAAVLLTGMLQIALGLARQGRWFNLIPEATLTAITTGLGLLICLDQVKELWTHSGQAFLPIVSVLACLLLPVLLRKVAPRYAQKLPDALIIILGGIVIAQLVKSIGLEGVDLIATQAGRKTPPAFHLTPWLSDTEQTLALLIARWKFIGASALTMFFMSTSKSLITTEILSVQTHESTDFDKELRALGIGNLCVGLLGGLPVASHIARSVLQRELSGSSKVWLVLQGLFLLAGGLLAPFWLKFVPTWLLVTVMLYSGWKLIPIAKIKDLRASGSADLTIFVVTCFGVLFQDVSAGVAIGIGMSVLTLALTFSNDFSIEMEASEDCRDVKIVLAGAATFLAKSRMQTQFRKIPKDACVSIDVKHVYYFDSTTIAFFRRLAQRQQANQGKCHLDWDLLLSRAKSPVNQRQKIAAELRQLDRRKNSRPASGRRAIDRYLMETELGSIPEATPVVMGERPSKAELAANEAKQRVG